MILNYIISVLLAPLLAAILVIIVLTKRGKDRYPGIFISFFAGMASVVVVLLFQYIAHLFGFDEFRNIRRVMFYSFFVMGFGSELGKFIILRYYCLPKKSFNGALDGIVYSIMIALGFVFMGNIIYLLFPYYSEVDFLYTGTIVIANLFFSVILGFFVGMAKTREIRFVDSMTGLFGVSFFNALYIFCFIQKDFRLLLFLSIGVFIIVILLYYKAYEINEEYKRTKNI